MKFLIHLIGCVGFFSVASAAVVVVQHHESVITLPANAGDVRVPTDTIIKRLSSDPVPTWTCNDPLGKVSVDLGTPVLKSGYLFYETIDVPVKTDNVPRFVTCVIKTSQNQVIEEYEIDID